MRATVARREGRARLLQFCTRAGITNTAVLEALCAPEPWLALAAVDAEGREPWSATLSWLLADRARHDIRGHLSPGAWLLGAPEAPAGLTWRSAVCLTREAAAIETLLLCLGRCSVVLPPELAALVAERVAVGAQTADSV